jgi:hypothetical protein
MSNQGQKGPEIPQRLSRDIADQADRDIWSPVALGNYQPR